MDIQEIVSKAKAAGHKVFKTKVAGIECVYRSITRKEFRDLQKKIADRTAEIKKLNPEGWEEKAALLKEEGEEFLVLRGLLQPKLDTELDLAGLPAGLVPVIAEAVMSGSGFGQEPEVTEL